MITLAQATVAGFVKESDPRLCAACQTHPKVPDHLLCAACRAICVIQPELFDGSDDEL